MERSLLSVMARRSVLVALLVGLVTAAPAGAQTGRLPDCADHSLPDLQLPNGYPFDVHRASALFRFHRQQEALRALDAARTIARGPWRWRVPSIDAARSPRRSMRFETAWPRVSLRPWPR